VNIRLCKMTKDLCRAYYKDFTNDPSVFMDMRRFSEYVYSPERADTYWQRQQDMDRIHLAIMLDEAPIGEIILKNIDSQKKCCTLSIHMQNDSVKNKGYGTRAEVMTLECVFYKLGMDTVFADAVLKNTRSQHVLEKVGFREISRSDTFVNYRCDKDSWILPNP